MKISLFEYTVLLRALEGSLRFANGSQVFVYTHEARLLVLNNLLERSKRQDVAEVVPPSAPSLDTVDTIL